MHHLSRPLRWLLLAASLLLASAPAAAAAPAEVLLAPAGTPPVKLTGGIAQFQGGIALPPRWRGFAGTVRLGWQANPALVAGSALQVTIDGQVIGTAQLGPGAGSATFTIPRRALEADQTSTQIAVQARLRLAGIPCPTPDDVRAYLQLTPESGVTINGAWSRKPVQLSDLPQAAVTGVGQQRSRLLVVTEEAPSASAIGAAAVAAGEIAVAAGRSVLVRMARSVDAAEADETVLRIAESAGPATISVAAPTGPPVITLSGAPDQLVRAAAAMRPSVARTLKGTQTRELPEVVVRRRALPRRLPLRGGTFEGYGKGVVTSSFDLPVWREALRGARLRVAVNYNAPAGGRAQVLVNGRGVDTQDLVQNGSPRFTVEEELAGRGPALQRGDLLPGRNDVQVDAQLTYPRTRCERPQELGSVRLTDFGSVTLLTRPRPVVPTLSTFPFPLNQRAGWVGSTVQLPPNPTDREAAAIIGTLAESRRLTGELVVPSIRVGTALPDGPALVLARPGAVPRELARASAGPAVDGVLTATPRNGSVQFLAIGAKALGPWSTNSSIGIVQGRAAEALSPSRVVVRLADAQRVTGVERGASSWRWPLLVVALTLLGLLFIGVRRAVRRLRSENE